MSKYTKEVLEGAAKISTNFSHLCRVLGIPPHGSSHAYIKKKCLEYGINTSHFNPYFGRKAYNKVSFEKRLVLRPEGSRREHAHVLRKALVASGIVYMCAGCGIESQWNGKKLVLEVNHINGVVWDDRPNNLEFLCPNCHSQTETYKTKNRRKNKLEGATGMAGD